MKYELLGGMLSAALVLGGTASAATKADVRMAVAQFEANVRAHHKPGGVDTTPPVIAKISVSGTVTATKAGQFVTVHLNATDDLSGVYGLLIVLASPDGSQTIVQQQYDTIPGTKYTLTEQMGEPRYDNPTGAFSITTEPGNWHVDQVYIADLAGNEAIYDAAQLAALGDTQFKVFNAKYDGTPPVLLSGSISTATLSLSAAPPGTPPGTLPLAALQTIVQDPVTPNASGIDWVAVTFCLPPYNGNTCADEFSVFSLTGVPVVNATTLTASGQIYSDINLGQPVTPGVYQMYAVQIGDISSNVASYVDTAFGGTVSLGSYFPTTTITISP
jgi:hypothetical protein